MFKTKQYKEQIESLTKETTKLKESNTNLEKEKSALLEENKELNEKVQAWEAIFTDEHGEVLNITDILASKKEDLECLEEMIQDRAATVDKLAEDKEKLQNAIDALTDEAAMREFGFRPPVYRFGTSQEYKEAINQCKDQQKQLSREKKAVYVDFGRYEKVPKIKSMANDFTKELLRAFNAECDIIISQVNYRNFDQSNKKIEKSYTSLNALNEALPFSSFKISDAYYNLKISELALTYEYKIKEQDEKDFKKEQAAIKRENAKVEKELAEEKAKCEKELRHYKNSLTQLNRQIELATSGTEEYEAIKNKIEETKDNIDDMQARIDDADYRQANIRAGYVYIISNIGAFGEGVYKIGMTRRLDPQERIDELGGASVPFRFDVHAFIFSEDAPKLETTLHKTFEQYRVNMVNNRKEFYRVPLEEIEKVVKENHNKTVEFNYIPDAEQWRMTESMRNTQA